MNFIQTMRQIKNLYCLLFLSVIVIKRKDYVLEWLYTVKKINNYKSCLNIAAICLQKFNVTLSVPAIRKSFQLSSETIWKRANYNPKETISSRRFTKMFLE